MKKDIQFLIYLLVVGLSTYITYNFIEVSYSPIVFIMTLFIGALVLTKDTKAQEVANSGCF